MRPACAGLGTIAVPGVIELSLFRGMSMRVLVVCYSQTGQLRRCAESLVAPLCESSDVTVDFVEPAPVRPYPFPWSFRAFWDVFPESVLQIPPEMKPLELPAPRYDLVILCYQVWYLSPSLPVTGFMRSPAAKVLDGTPVIALCACRNMWQTAWLELRKHISAAGGRLIDHIALIDAGPDWATFVTTPRWLWTGRRTAFGIFPAAGVAEEKIAGLRSAGERLLQAMKRKDLATSVLKDAGLSTVKVRRVFVVPEFLTRNIFKAWARFIRGAGTIYSGFRYPLEILFFVLLCSWILLLPLAVPIAAAVRLLGRSWFRNRVAVLSEPYGEKAT
jgi:hypothetical protein